MKINITLILILALIAIGLKGRSQVNAQYVKGSTAVGSKVVSFPELTVTNSALNVGVEKSLLPNPDTLFASSMTVGSRYSFILQVNITTPLLTVGTMTIKLKSGGLTLTLANGIGLNGLNTTTPIYITGEIDVKSMTSQIINARLVQWNGVAIPVGTASMTPQADWNLDLTQQQTFDITATFTGVTLGTTSYKSREFRRYIEQ